MEVNSIICGAMPEATKVFPDGYFNCSISSPPYWGLRDYGLPPSIWDGDMNCEHKWVSKKTTLMHENRNFTGSTATQEEAIATGKETVHIFRESKIQTGFCSKCGAWLGTLGLEPTFELYIKHLCTIYDEVKRVLRDDGTCWVNLGDTYGMQQGKGFPGTGQVNLPEDNRNIKIKKQKSVPDKSLCLIPQRFAIEMVNRGWILRNVIIWKKPNPMPSSAKDRFTVDFEYVYFFVKSKKYWFEPQYEPYNYDGRHDTTMKSSGKYIGCNEPRASSNWMHETTAERWPNPLGRNKRTVWTIPTQPYPEAHFATFPEKLVEPMIKAGCPEFVCTKCGKAREKIYEPTEEYKKKLGSWQKGEGLTKGFYAPEKQYSCTKEQIFKGYTDCGCNADWRPGRTLDCFCWKLYYWQGRRQVA